MPDQTLPQILFENPLDEAPDPREQQIWERLNRGPRDRGDELTKKGWEDRYGINEGSGKRACLFAGLGEAGRAVAQGKQYKSIADAAQEQGLKEYQVEVSPLQRELGVISANKRAQAALSQKTAFQEAKMLQDAYVAERRLGQTDEDLIRKGKFTRAQIQKIVADISLNEAKTENVKTDTANDKATGGLTGVFGAANTWGQNPTDPQTQGKMRTWADMQGLTAALRGSGAPKVPTTSTSTSTGTKYVTTDQGVEAHPDTRVSVRSGMAPDPNAIAQNVDAARARLLNPQAPAGTPAPTPQTPAAAPIPALLPQPVAPAKRQPVVSVDGQAFREDPNPASARQVGFRGGRFTSLNVDPSWSNYLKSYTKNEDPENLPPRFLSKFKGRLIGGAKTTDEQRVQTEFRSSIRSLADDSMSLFANNKLGEVTGIPGGWVTQFKAMMPAGVDISNIKTRSEAVNTMANYILAKSGKAVTENERRILMQSLPNLDRDSAPTLMQKTLVLQVLARRMSFQQGMRLSDDEMDSLMRSPSGRRAADMDKKIYNILDAVNKATRNGQKAVTVYGPPDPKTGKRASVQFNSRQGALDAARATMEEDFALLTKGIKEVFN